MTDHIANMRAQVGANTPVVMTQFQGMGSGAYSSYNTAIATLASTIDQVYAVPATGAGLRDTNHWNYSGMKLVAGRMLDVIEANY